MMRREPHERAPAHVFVGLWLSMLMLLAEAPSHEMTHAEPDPFEQVQPPSFAPGPSAIPPLHLAV